MIKPSNTTGDSLTQKTPEEQQKTEELKQMIGQKDLAVIDDETSEITDKQELLGYDEKQDDFVVRDPVSGKVKVVKSTQINKMKAPGEV